MHFNNCPAPLQTRWPSFSHRSHPSSRHASVHPPVSSQSQVCPACDSPRCADGIATGRRMPEFECLAGSCLSCVGSTRKMMEEGCLCQLLGRELGAAVSQTWLCPHPLRYRNSKNRADPVVSWAAPHIHLGSLANPDKCPGQDIK